MFIDYYAFNYFCKAGSEFMALAPYVCPGSFHFRFGHACGKFPTIKGRGFSQAA